MRQSSSSPCQPKSLDAPDLELGVCHDLITNLKTKVPLTLLPRSSWKTVSACEAKLGRIVIRQKPVWVLRQQNIGETLLTVIRSRAPMYQEADASHPMLWMGQGVYRGFDWTTWAFKSCWLYQARYRRWNEWVRMSVCGCLRVKQRTLLGIVK